MSGRYADMLHLPHPEPEGRKPLSPWQRGAQFSPFAALTGFDGVVAEEGRQTREQIFLGEDGAQALDAQLRLLAAAEQTHPKILAVWFCPDGKKEGGSYISTTGHLKKLDAVERKLVLQEGFVISLEQLLWIEKRTDTH